MAKRERISKPRTKVQKNTRTEVVDEKKPTRSVTEAEALAAEMDELLDEIDDVLEQNAEEFVSQYVQRGGQ